ncbi:MAG: glycosyltransferase [Bacteroidetes bacterium]|nr:glycosyltransferase [Bacteroidota bacterium]
MKRILIFYSHFSPAFKAGGPVQSLVNLVTELHDHFEFYVFCSAYEMGEKDLLTGIKPDEWNKYAENVQVYYASNSVAVKIKSEINRIDPDFIYVNGMFLFFYNTIPLWLAKTRNKKVVIAPRGMLQEGALAIKPFKKKLFLSMLKLTDIFKNIIWHATDEQEAKDVRKIIGSQSTVRVAANIPRAIANSNTVKEKAKGELRLVFLSLITEKKNLHLILEALKQLRTPIQFDIYGPVIDEGYWLTCKKLMEEQIHTIRYQGAIEPNTVQETLSKYHAFILPTKGENFGHAIYEALSVGTPVLVSPYTPWGRLQDYNAGITIEALDQKYWSKAIQKFIDMELDEYSVYSKGSYDLAKNYFSKNDFKFQYQSLFS